MKKYSVLPSYPNKISKNVYQEGLVVFQVASIKYIIYTVICQKYSEM